MKRLQAAALIFFVVVFYCFITHVPLFAETPNDTYKVVLPGRITTFDVSAEDSDVLFAVVLDKTAKSIDGGETWQDVGSITKIATIAIDSKDPKIIYAAQGG